MNITVTFKSDKKSMSKQLPFAFASALTQTAKDGQAASIAAIKQDFTLRNSWYEPGNRFGVKISPATKTSLVTAVGTDAEWLIPFEVTGVKLPRGKRIALPVIGGARTTFAAKIASRLLPKNLASKAFVINTSVGPILYYRKGRGKKKGLQALYFLDPQVKVKMRSVLFDPVQTTFEKNFQANLDKAIANAMATAR